MRVFVFISIIILLVAVKSFSQNTAYTSEFGIFLGDSYYIGDLNPGGHFNKFTHAGGGVLYRHNFNPRFAFRGNVLYGTLRGDDSETNSAAQQQRNLHFKSYVLEASTQLEFNFMEYRINDLEYPFSPYLFLGVGLFNFNPKAEIDGNWYALRPLGTEGQETSSNPGFKKYSLIQASVPFGAGIKFNIGEKAGISLEWGMRKTFTDYIDDVSKTYPDLAMLAAEKGPVAAMLSDRSLVQNNGGNNSGRQRGISGTKDWYSFSGIILSFKIGGEKEKCYNLK